MNQEQDECLMNSQQAIRSAPQSQIHKSKHAQTSVIVSPKSTFYTSSHQQTMVEKHKTIKCDVSQFFLPPSIMTIKNQLLEERPMNSNSTKTEDNLHWFYGTLILGMKNGYGKFYVKNMYYYEGKFLANKKHGKGLLIHENGHHYVFQISNKYGEFFADKILGKNGIYEDFELKCSKNENITHQKLDFPNGAVYEGQVLDGKRFGKGVYQWKDGTKYEGSFQDDQFHGFGVMIYADGRKYRGEWVKGQMEGIGEFTWPDTQEYRGQYQQNKKHGFGIFKYKSGIKYTGHFENGLNHGTGVLTQLNCKPQISQWVKGERIE